MKIVETIKATNKKGKVKKRPFAKPKKEHVLIVAQEIKFARLLAGNELKTRDRALKTLKKWLLNCFEKGYEFKEDDFARIWKGLFYAVWMSDKPLVQEELCENIAGILDLFPAEQLRAALLMVKVGLRVLAAEWYGIDQHRMDKCLMLVRRYLRGALRCVLRCGWSLESCQMFTEMLSSKDGILALNTPLYARNATSMILHVIDCFLEELAKVSQGEISPDSVAELLRPICAYTCGGAVPALTTACRRALTALLRQSELGLRYQGATRAWEKIGCPRGGPDAMQLVSDDEAGGDTDDDDEAAGALDPRAGRVDVTLPTLPVPSRQLAAALRSLLAGASSRAHKRAKICMQRFEQLAADQYPLRVVEPPRESGSPSPQPARAARALHQLEKRLASASDELALRGLSRKHRKRLLAKSRAGLSIVEEVEELARGVSTASANGEWQVEEAKPQNKKKDTTNEENIGKSMKHKRKLDQEQNGDVRAKKLRLQPKAKEEAKKLHSQSKENLTEQKKLRPKKVKDKTRDTKIENGGDKHVISKYKNTPAIIKENRKLTNAEETVEKSKKTEAKVVKNKNAPSVVVSKVKNFQKQLAKKSEKKLKIGVDNSENSNVTGKNRGASSKRSIHTTKVRSAHSENSNNTEKIRGGNSENSISTPKRVKFVLKNNSMQGAVDYYKSVRQSPTIPFDSTKRPSKTNLKVSTPSPINPFFKKKLRLKK